VFLLLDVDACRAAQIDRGCQIQVDAAQATGSLAQAFGLRLRARSRLDLWQVPGEQGLYRSRKQKRTRVLVLVRDKGRARGRETRDREIGTKRKSPPIESQMEAEFLAAFHRAVKVSPFWIMSLCLSFSFSLSRMPIDDKPGQRCDIRVTAGRATIDGRNPDSRPLSVPMWISIDRLSRVLSGRVVERRLRRVLCQATKTRVTETACQDKGRLD